VGDLDKERDAVANELKQARHEKQTAAQLAEANQKFAITEAVNAVEKERDGLKNDLKQAQLEKQLAEKSLKEKFETQIKDRDDAIERLRDMKARLSSYSARTVLPMMSSNSFFTSRKRISWEAPFRDRRPETRTLVSRTARIMVREMESSDGHRRAAIG
jgi:hypothetical protein